MTHTSTSKNIRIHEGQFSHFRLVGEGIDDANLAADLSAASFKLKITSVPYGSQEAELTYNPFDLYMFHGGESGDAAYECFVDKANSYVKHGTLDTCPFLDSANNDAWVKSALFEYEFSKYDLLATEILHQDFFLVIDNSGWYSAVQNQVANPDD